MPLNNIFTGRLQGSAVLIGNTNVLTSSTAPVDTSSNVYTTTIPSLQVSGYPPGTTLTQSQNSSSSILNLPTGSTVTFAYLMWTVAYESSVAPITFVTPKATYSVSSSTVQTIGTNTWRAANVTSMVASDGGGTYIVGNIHGNLNTLEGVVCWTLAVVYTNSLLPTRYINLNAGIVSYPPTIFNFTNIETPVSGAITAYYLYAGIHGQYSDLTKASVGPVGGPYSLIGNTSNPWNGITPYNRQVSLFPSNICVADPQSANVGLLDTTGTFGTYNINPYGTTPPTIPPAARVLYDLTAIDISSFVTNNQTSLSIQINGGTGGQSIFQGLQININAPALNLVKSVDKTSAIAGDTLLYTAVIKNNGTFESDNTIFLDTIPSGSTFISNTFTYNAITIPSVTASPIKFNMLTIPIGSTNTITFKVMVTQTTTTTLLNSFETSYIYTPILGGATYSGITDSNIVSTSIAQSSSDLSKITKDVDKRFSTVGEILTYTVTIPNLGNTIANNVIFYDTIPTNSTFIPNSLIINNVPSSSNPQNGISIGSISVGSISTVIFSVLVPNTVPSPNTITNNSFVNFLNATGTTISNISNSVITTINAVILSSSKQVNKNYATVGDILTYTIPITNSGNVTATNIVFVDTIPNGTTIVTGSFKQDGITIVGNLNPPGVTLPNSIKSFSTSTVTFQVVVTTIPVPNPIPNTASSTATYIIDSTILPNKIGTAATNTNIVNTQINNANLSNIVKYTDKNYASCGDSINYTIVIPNSGNTTAQNVIFKDTIPNGTTLIATSIFVNNIPQSEANPTTGITIPNIAPGSIATIVFAVRVVC